MSETGRVFRKLDRYHPSMDQLQKLFARMSERYPEPDDEDRLHARARAAIAAIPGVGGPITELMNMVLVPPVARRRDEWLRELAEVVEEIGRKVKDFEPTTLAQNDAFVSAFIRTSRIAIGTHRQEKRRLLRNALVKIGTGEACDEDMQEIWFRLIEDLTPSHLRLLNFFLSAVQWMRRERGEMPIGITYGSRSMFKRLRRSLENMAFIARQLLGRRSPLQPSTRMLRK